MDNMEKLNGNMNLETVEKWVHNWVYYSMKFIQFNCEANQDESFE